MKGIATETIGKMLLVVIVVAVVVVLLYLYVLGPALPESTCKAMMTSWCANCELTRDAQGKYSGGPKMSDKLKECLEKYKFASTHENCENAENDCKGFVPQKTTT
jgi:hypothetical protein